MKYEILKIEKKHWYNFWHTTTVEMENGDILKILTPSPKDGTDFKYWLEGGIYRFYYQAPKVGDKGEIKI
jgi:TusA-related sulfurtransferase